MITGTAPASKRPTTTNTRIGTNGDGSGGVICTGESTSTTVLKLLGSRVSSELLAYACCTDRMRVRIASRSPTASWSSVEVFSGRPAIAEFVDADDPDLDDPDPGVDVGVVSRRCSKVGSSLPICASVSASFVFSLSNAACALLVSLVAPSATDWARVWTYAVLNADATEVAVFASGAVADSV